MSQPEEDDRYSEDAAPLSNFSNLRIAKGKENRKSDEIEVVVLLCGHEIPLDYLIAWCKYCLKQNKNDFTCPRFDEGKKKICGKGFSYQVLCQKAKLTPELKEHFEERLGALTAARLCEYKPCPGCQSYVERADKKNLCVRCTICTSRTGSAYEFCWNCRREWKGPVVSALKCANDGCGKQEVSPPNPLVLCQPEFKRYKLQKEKNDIYPMTDKNPARKRLALLINNIEFQYLNDRIGADKDELSMEKLFEGLGYAVVTLRNLSAKGMDTAMRDFSQREEHKLSDSCFVVFMSHGSASGLHGIFDLEGNDVFSTNEIFKHLNTPNCAGLRDKPKIILIQSCRGSDDGEVYVQDSGNQRLQTEHREKDFCCLRSCTPDTVSYRDKKKGSCFIQDIVEIFNQYAHQDHIEELFRKVLKKFKETHPTQMPCKERTTLSKRFYLFPGLKLIA
ncbi:caspase-23 [Colossoma macropomum]|uniref:caspase-23 n=1 Tax=Colossoma macropomum TaxID=42526 RepID=UPI0018655A4C|nr:caspase-23 [Colossoma macropomum]